MALQRHASPIPGDVTEQSVFDLVPFACPWRIVADFDSQSRFVCKALKFILPNPIAMTVASSAVRRYQESLRLRIAFLSQSMPPAAYRFDRKLRSVSTDANGDPGFVGFHVIHAIGNGFAELFVGKVVRVDFERLPFWSVLTPDIRLFPEGFLLFRIDRDRRTTPAATGTNATGDVFKLGIAVRVVAAFACLPVPLQGISQRTKNF